MQVRFQKLSNDRHRLTVIRRNGTVEMADLETKSLLKHDFLHLALESEAGLQHSFWGLVASGKSFLELSGKMEGGMISAANSEIATTEMLVGALTGAEKEQNSSSEFVERFSAWCREVGMECPTWLTAELIGRVRERLRHIQGKWNATPFGETMEVTWNE